MNPLHPAVRVCWGIASRVRNVWFRSLGVRITGYVWLRRVSIPRLWSDITIEGGCSLDDGVVLLSSESQRPDKIVIRSGTYVNRHTMFDASESIEIGCNCMIGPFCYITDHDHGHTGGTVMNQQPLITRPVRIGNDIWIGSGVVVLKGVSIGDGAVIGAGAVVTKDVPPRAKMVGIPARQIGVRN